MSQFAPDVRRLVHTAKNFHVIILLSCPYKMLNFISHCLEIVIDRSIPGSSPCSPQHISLMHGASNLSCEPGSRKVFKQICLSGAWLSTNFKKRSLKI